MWPDKLPTKLTKEEAEKFRVWVEENAYEFDEGETARVNGKFYVLPKAKLEILLKSC